ncbi:MAG: efflux RND transporter periplasmic adaptor subunit [Butyricimonas faecihominis]
MVKNLILSIIAIAILAGCSGKKDKTTDSDVVEAIPVKVQKLEKTDIARTLDYAANLEADKQVFYAPAATGRIEKIYVEVGDQIKKGQVLVEMDKTQLVQAEVQLKNLETEYNRAIQLNETGSISKQAYDAAVTLKWPKQRGILEGKHSNARSFLMESLPENTSRTRALHGSFFRWCNKPSIIVEKIDPVSLRKFIRQYYLTVKPGKVELKIF